MPRRTRGAPAPRGPVRRALADLDRRPRKRFGQHLLADPSIIARIIDLAQLSGTETVVEIGPGLGALSDGLAARCARLLLVEVDRDFAARLRERFAARRHVEVIERDVLKADLAALAGGRFRVVANLPYNISTPVLFQLLEYGAPLERVVLMLQREVAERIRAGVGDDAYGALSVLVQWHVAVTHGLHVPPAAFVPRPRVDSEVIVLTPHRTPPAVVRDPRALRRVVRAAFQQRRKQLVNSLAAATPDPTGVLAAAAIDATRRAETLSLAEFARLANALTAHGSGDA